MVKSSVSGRALRALAVVTFWLGAAAFPQATLAAPEPILGTNGAPVPSLEWTACPASGPAEEFLADYECASAEVPLSYRDPSGQSIEIALGRLPASDPARKIGTLFWNPGGPGGSGRFPPAFSEALHERFDIVGFDPRGIAASTPLRCVGTNEALVRLFGWEFAVTPAQERRVIDLARRGTQRCARNGGPILEHMATGNVARDLDLLRQAIGEEQLSYLGFSYGTHIGEVYANLFPDRVRALTLDGVIDPVEWTTGASPAEAEVPVEFRLKSYLGAYQALTTFLDECEKDERCAFREEGRDLLGKYDTLLRRLRRRPVRMTDPEGNSFVVTYQLAVYETLGGLYFSGNASDLAAILQEAWAATEQRTAEAPKRISHDLSASFRPSHLRQVVDDEPYLGFEWTPAVQCTDSDNPSDPWQWPRYARRADREAPYFGSAWVYFSIYCATWPVVDEDRYAGPWNRQTANPVLLIGNRKGDPATPFEDAVSTSRLLADARLLTLDGYGHTALRESQCIVDAVERYLIEKQLPAEGTVCQPDRRPFDTLPEGIERKRQLLDEALAPPTVPLATEARGR